jgi:4-hydroxybenzoate polyprenyltransferase
VARTKGRPLATGKIKPKEALVFFALLLGLAALILPFLNRMTFIWSLGALALAVVYPFMKRLTFLPQVVLGAAFSWGIPMAFTAQDKLPDHLCWLLYAANLAWTVAYDTQYAMADRDDDLKAGIKSTAILFGELDRFMVGCLQATFLVALWLLGRQLPLAWPFPVSLLAAALLFFWQARLTRERESAACLAAFLHNHWVGGVLFAGLFLGYVLAPAAS